MYKLVVVGGKLRGSEFELGEGAAVVGRAPDCDVQIESSGISKKHMQVTVKGESVYLEDLDSANGTFVNGKLVKRGSLKGGDRIALPNVILQLVYVAEKKVIVTKKVMKEEEDDSESVMDDGPMPTTPLGKLIYLFKQKIMPIFYGFNQEYEWRGMIAVVFVVFIVINISLVIFPVLQDNKRLLLSEVAKRGFHYADEIARLNAASLNRKELDRVDTNFLDNESGVESYELFDLEGRIVRPLGKLNDFIEDPFSIAARDAAIDNKEKYSRNLGGGQYGISKTIKAYNVKLGIEEPVGVIAIRFAPTSLVLEAANNSKAYLESFVTSILVGIVFFGIIYFLTIKNLEDLKYQIDQVLRNKAKDLEPRFKMEEIRTLRNSVNSILHKNKELSGEAGAEGDFGDMEEDTKYVGILDGFLEGTAGAALVLDSQKVVKNLNTEGEDLTGIRLTAAQDMELFEVARDQGFAATIIDLCDQSANSDGVCCKGEYELTGAQYIIAVNSLMGKDNFAKAFFVSFIKDE